MSQEIQTEGLNNILEQLVLSTPHSYITLDLELKPMEDNTISSSTLGGLQTT